MTIALKDLRSYYHSFSFYFLFAMFAAISGFFFWLALNHFALASFQAQTTQDIALRAVNMTDGVISPFIGNLCALALLVIPILSMRAFSEERKAGTLELLVTYPVSDFQIVLGKFVALMTLFLFMILPTTFYFLMAAVIRAKFEVLSLVSGYAGLWLVAMSFASLCLFVSSLTSEQVVSTGIGFLLLLFFWIVGWIAEWVNPSIGFIFRELSLVEHLRDFSRGIIDTKDVAFYLIFVSFFLFATLSVLEVRSWKR